MTSPTPEDLRELYHRAYELAKRASIRHEGNGFYQHEYEIGDVSYVVCGHFEYQTGKPIETDLFIDTGELVTDEVIEVIFGEHGYTGEEEIIIKENADAVLVALKLARQHMVLDDLSDV